MKISLYPPLSIHEIGNRDNQEDALWPLQPTVNDRLFVLCDGMGGHEHGEVASQTVTQALGQWFAEHVDASTLDLEYFGNKSGNKEISPLLSIVKKHMPCPEPQKLD